MRVVLVTGAHGLARHDNGHLSQFGVDTVALANSIGHGNEGLKDLWTNGNRPEDLRIRRVTAFGL
jgi:hypothetical protein